MDRFLSAEEIFGLKRDEIIGRWKKLRNELHGLHSSQNIIRIIKSMRMTRAGHVVCVGENRNAYSCFGGKVRRMETARKT
jgi:hypothetical protein